MEADIGCSGTLQAIQSADSTRCFGDKAAHSGMEVGMQVGLESQDCERVCNCRVALLPSLRENIRQWRR